MSVAFNGTSSLLSWAGELVGAYPCSIFCWIKPASASVNQMVLGSGDFGGTREIAIYAEGAGTGKVKVFSNAGGSTSGESTTGVQTSWQPALAVFASATNRKIYYAAGAVVTDSNSSDPFDVAHDRFCIGERPISATLRYTGDVAEVAMWSSALSQTDFNSLAGGALPETVQSGTLVEAWKLESATDLTGVNGRTLTATSVTNGVTHPITRGASPHNVTIANSQQSNVGTAGGVSQASTTFVAGSNSTQTNTASAGAVTQPAGGTITLPPLAEWETDTLLPSQSGITVWINHEETGALVLKLTGVTTAAVTAAFAPISHASIVAGTAYSVRVRLASGAQFTWTYTAS